MNEIKIDQIWRATQNPYALQGLSWPTPWELNKTYKVKNVLHIPNDDRLITFSPEVSEPDLKTSVWAISSSNFLLGFEFVS